MRGRFLLDPYAKAGENFFGNDLHQNRRVLAPGVDTVTMEYNYVPRNDAELAHFDGLWAAASNGAKELSGLQAVTFFKQSGVDLGILKQIWGFSTPTATMNLAQFYNALRYICMFQTGW